MPSYINHDCKKVVINKRYGGFGLSLDALYKCVKNNSILVHEYEYGSCYTSDWDMFIKTYLNKNYKKYKASYSPPYLYDENKKVLYAFDNHLKRDDPELVELVEEMGSKASGSCANLEIIEIPNDVEYEIQDYDGFESIHEKHRVWG